MADTFIHLKVGTEVAILGIEHFHYVLTILDEALEIVESLV